MDVRSIIKRGLMTSNDPSLNGYTQSIRYVNQLPVGTPTPDPTQYESSIWATPYGDNQIIHKSDITSAPLGYRYSPNGYSAGATEESITNDLLARIEQAGLNRSNWETYIPQIVDAVNVTEPTLSVRQKVMRLLRYTGHATAEAQKDYWDTKARLDAPRGR